MIVQSCIFDLIPWCHTIPMTFRPCFRHRFFPRHSMVDCTFEVTSKTSQNNSAHPLEFVPLTFCPFHSTYTVGSFGQLPQPLRTKAHSSAWSMKPLRVTLQHASCSAKLKDLSNSMCQRQGSYRILRVPVENIFAQCELNRNLSHLWTRQVWSIYLLQHRQWLQQERLVFLCLRSQQFFHVFPNGWLVRH